jgi:putative transposase
MITRRTTRRFFLLRPDADGALQRLYWYATAVMAKKFGIELHAVQILSTHMHEVLTDVHGVLPAFLRERNRLFANAVKCHRRWPEEVFQRAPASCVELYGAAAIVKQIGYVLANCVEAGLVDSPSSWPGVTVDACDIGERVVEVHRPAVYFDPANEAWPERASLPIRMPGTVLKAYGSDAGRVLRKAVGLAVKSARKVARRTVGRPSMSVAALTSVSTERRAESPDPPHDRNPTFAAAGDPLQIQAALRERRVFRGLYRAALWALRNGVAGIPFPAGTWRWPRELLRQGLDGGAPRTFDRADRAASAESPDASTSEGPSRWPAKHPSLASRSALSYDSWDGPP